MSSRLDAPMMITLSRPSTPSISLSSCGTMVFSTSEDTPEPRVRNSESISSKKTITGIPSRRLVPRPLEDQPDVPLGLAHVLVQQLGALDVEEEAAPLLAGPLAHLLGQRVGHRLGDQGLAAAGRAVQQDALRCLELVLGEQVPVQERQLDGVPDGLDLGAEAADHRVVDVRHLLQHQLLDVQLGDPLVGEVDPAVDQQRVTGADRLLAEPVGQPDHALLVAVPDDQARDRRPRAPP